MFAAVLGLATSGEGADAQIRPYVGLTFAGDTTFAPNLVDAAGKVHATIGINAAWLRDVIGIDVDVARTPGFFQTGNAGELIITSAVTTTTGNLVIAAPRRFTEYVLRPYIVAGAGIIHIRAEDALQVFDVNEVRPTIDFGVGAVGFVTNFVGLVWEVRRFQSIGAEQQRGLSIGGERLSFWRATMGVAIRY